MAEAGISISTAYGYEGIAGVRDSQVQQEHQRILEINRSGNSIAIMQMPENWAKPRIGVPKLR